MTYFGVQKEDHVRGQLYTDGLPTEEQREDFCRF